MDVVERDELRALRARAYGPDADIQQDPVALRRLQELESRSGDDSPAATASRTGDADSPAESPSQGDPDAERPDAAVTEEASASVERAAGRPRSVRRRRWIAVLWPLSIVAAALVAWGVTLAVASSSPAAEGPGHEVAVLEATGVRNLPAEWFGTSSSSLVFEFHGLTLLTTDSGASAGANCFMAVATSAVPDAGAGAQAWSEVAILLSGCQAGAFPAEAQTIVGERMPEELRSVFPKGSALKFVLEGDRIVVFSDDG